VSVLQQTRTTRVRGCLTGPIGEDTDNIVIYEADDRLSKINFLFKQSVTHDIETEYDGKLFNVASQRTHSNSTDSIYCVEQVQYFSN
jgi:hypothetical protein